MKNKAIFLDRDGVIIEDKGYICNPKEVKFIKKSISALSKLKKKGYKLIIITNQSGIGRGYYKEEDYLKVKEEIWKRLERYNAKIDVEYFCPHHPKEKCNCRKPNISLIKKSIKKLNIDVKKSYFIGDKKSDIQAGEKAELKTILLLSGKTKKAGIPSFSPKPDFVCNTLFDAYRIILKKKQN